MHFRRPIVKSYRNELINCLTLQGGASSRLFDKINSYNQNSFSPSSYNKQETGHSNRLSTEVQRDTFLEFPVPGDFKFQIPDHQGSPRGIPGDLRFGESRGVWGNMHTSGNIIHFPFFTSSKQHDILHFQFFYAAKLQAHFFISGGITSFIQLCICQILLMSYEVWNGKPYIPIQLKVESP